MVLFIDLINIYLDARYKKDGKALSKIIPLYYQTYNTYVPCIQCTRYNLRYIFYNLRYIF